MQHLLLAKPQKIQMSNCLQSALDELFYLYVSLTIN